MRWRSPRLPDEIRGFGPVKAAAIAGAQRARGGAARALPAGSGAREPARGRLRPVGDDSHVHDRHELRARRGDRGAARDGAPLRAGEDRAARRRDRPHQRVPARSLAGDGRARPARHHRRGGVRRRRHGLSRALRRDGGDQPRLGLGRPLLRRALQPLRQPDPPQRHARAEAQIPAEADLGRACRRARDERAGLRLGRRLDAHPRRAQGQRRLRAQRQQDVDHQRPGRRDAGGLRQDRRPMPGPRGITAFLVEHGMQGFSTRAEARQARHARLRHLRAGVRGLRGAARERAGRGRPGRRRC